MMQKKRFSKQVKSLVSLILHSRTVPQVHLTQEQAEALSRAVLADDALVPREVLVGVAFSYQKLLKNGVIKPDVSFEEIVKYAKN